MPKPNLAAVVPLAALAALAAPTAGAEVLRTPTSVNVNSQGATTVFISYGQLVNVTTVEALWCGRIISAAPDRGMKCDPSTVWGRLPVRNDQSRTSGSAGFTDIMTIPQSLTRRAYEAAARGSTQFYYVRRFESTTGGPDEYVWVACRLTGGGAGTPLALLDVDLAFDTQAPVLSVRPGETPPPIVAKLTYTGTGRLRGRWEIVKPGDPQPTVDDLVSEATLPVEKRALQRRYLEIERFNVYLPPGGTAELPGPDPGRLPTEAEGLYQVLLRIEASTDAAGGADLADVNEGAGVVSTGGVTGYPLPPLRYYVGAAPAQRLGARASLLAARLPQDGAAVAGTTPELSWMESAGAAFFQVEVMDSAGAVVVAALLPPGIGSYRLPGFVAGSAAAGPLRWRVQALDPDGEQLTATEWRTFTITADKVIGGAPPPGEGGSEEE